MHTWQKIPGSYLTAEDDHERLTKHVCDEEAQINEIVAHSSTHFEIHQHASDGSV